MSALLRDCDRDVLIAAETAVDNWKQGLKERKNGDVLAVESIQFVERAVDKKRQIEAGLHSDLNRALTIFTEHLLSTVGDPRVLNGWLDNKTAESEIQKVLRVFYELGQKETKLAE